MTTKELIQSNKKYYKLDDKVFCMICQRRKDYCPGHITWGDKDFKALEDFVSRYVSLNNSN